ncbi:hypothetical protein OUZ56_012055 [Daphnia magna]|uniref:Uncharacterized protein n=1 Tax=Daphnia magna TaxID=35525 RepID=A0ABQ9Z1W8_9CRUS|nr:hypothetical protein OUZ56_012055 [Daphnia magna]
MSMEQLRQDNPPMSEILAEIEKDYQILSRKLVQSDPLFALNPIVVTSNNERTSINKSESRTFALQKNTRRFSWQETLFGYYISEMLVTQNEINSLYLHDDSLTRYFVENAPGFFTENIKPKKGLVNSTAVTYHSLVLDDNEDRERIAEKLMCSTSNDDIALQYPPKNINVRVDNANPDDFVDMTILPGKVVIPITVLVKGTPHKEYVLSKPQMVTFSSRSHNVDLQFSKTFHKVQGKTCKRVTVDESQ